MDLPLADIIYQDETTLIVSCPYCRALHKHASGADVIRTSHCFSGSYRMGSLISSAALVTALNSRKNSLEWKRRHRIGARIAKGQGVPVGAPAAAAPAPPAAAPAAPASTWRSGLPIRNGGT